MKENSTYKDESAFVTQLKNREKEGIEKLYDSYSNSLYGVIYKVVLDQKEAEDILQDTFIKIWQKIDSYDSSKGRLYTWMINIARNASIDHTRSKHFKKSVKVQSLDIAVHNQTDKRSEIQDETIGMKDLVNKLDPKYKALIDKVYFEGYTQQEVSEELNIPLGTVKTRIRNALIELRKFFKI